MFFSMKIITTRALIINIKEKLEKKRKYTFLIKRIKETPQVLEVHFILMENPN